MLMSSTSNITLISFLLTVNEVSFSDPKYLSSPSYMALTTYSPAPKLGTVKVRLSNESTVYSLPLILIIN